MSATIDQKVVEMRFDNRQFEAGVSDTMTSIEKLNSSLQFKGSTQGFDSISDAAQRTGSSLEDFEYTSYKTGFSWRDVLAKVSSVVEWNMAQRAVDTLTHSLKGLADQMLGLTAAKAGFSEYELKMGSIQTIMAGTGESLETVNGYLEELNAYSDRTIYSFADMTSNIGKFTNAGVKLEDAVSAIQGVSNVAALSGANANEASRAMYNFSQALSSGYVKLIDWKSIENANMATVGFKEQLIETAVALGTVTKEADGTYKTLEGHTFSSTKGFNEVFQDQWMTSEVLIQTLAKYSDETTEIGKKAFAAATEVKTFSQMMDTLKESAQSGWAQTWELIFGDFEAGKSLWTGINEMLSGVIDSTSNARNELLKDWKVLGGRDSLFSMTDEDGNRIDALMNVFNAIKSVIVPIKEAFTEIFPPITAERLFALTEGIREFTSRLILSDDTSDKLKQTFKGLFSVLDIVGKGLQIVFKIGGYVFDIFATLCGAVLDVAGSFGDWLDTLNGSIEAGDNFARVLDGIDSFMSPLVKMVKTFINVLKDGFIFPGLDFFYALLGQVADRMSGIGKVAEWLRSGLVSAFDAIGSALENCSLFRLFETLWNVIKAIASGVTKIFTSLIGGLSDKLGGGGLGGVIELLNAFITGGVGIALIKFIKGASEALDGFASPLETIKDVFGKVTGILDGVKDSLTAWQTNLKADTLTKIATAIAILTAALVVITLIDTEKLMGALGIITGLFVEMMTSMAIISKIDPGVGIAKVAGAMTSLATALLILAIAMKIMSGMSLGEMGVALIGLAGGLAALVIAVNLLPEKNVKAAASSIKKMSTALLILSLALKIMGTMSWSELAVGLTAMAAGLAAMVVAVNLLPKDTFARAAGLTGLATAMVILAAALKIMATMSWEDVAVSLVTLAGSMAILAVGLNFMKSALPGAAAMFIVAPALVLLASALVILGTLSWEQVATGLVAFAGAMVILAVGMTAMVAAIPGAAAMLIAAPALVLLAAALTIMGTMSWEQVGASLTALAGALVILAVGMTAMIAALPGAAAMLVVSAALAIFVPVLLALGSVSWETIGKGLLALAGVFTVIGVAGLVLAPLVPVLLGLSAAIVLIGTGCLLAGVGIVAFATGLSLLVSAGVAGVNVLVTALVSLCEGIVNSIPAITAALTAVIVALCDALITCVPKILECLGVLLTEMLDFLVAYIPKIVDVGMQLITGLLTGIANRIGDVVSAAGDIIVNFVNGLSTQMSRIINAGVSLITNFITGLASGILKVVSTAVDVAIAFVRGIHSQISKVVQAGIDMMIDFINGLADGIRTNTKRVIEAVNNLMSAVFEAIGMYVGNIPELGRQLIQGFCNGIAASAGKLWDTIVGVVKNAWNGVLNFLGIKSPSRLAAEAGRFVDEGLAVGLEKYSKLANNAAVGVGETTMKSLNDTLSDASNAIGNTIDTQPTIRPVLDLSGVKSGANSISSMFGSGALVGVSANVGAINSMMDRRSQNGGNDDVVSAIDTLSKKLDNVGNTYNSINGVTYDDGSSVANAIKTIIQAAKVERRV